VDRVSAGGPRAPHVRRHPLGTNGGWNHGQLFSRENPGLVNDRRYDEFETFFKENRLWRDVALEQEIEGFIQAIGSRGTTLSVYRDREGEGEAAFDEWRQGLQQAAEELPPLRKAIEARFRELLGVAEAHQ
jgi:hypothetical protein